jgi:hypothetical protein
LAAGKARQLREFIRDGAATLLQTWVKGGDAQKVGDHKKSLIKLAPQTQPAKSLLNKKGGIPISEKRE